MSLTINDETWLTQEEAAKYINRSTSTLRTAIKRYEMQTGKIIEKLPDGQKVRVRQSDLDELIKVRFPVLAREKGLL